MHDYDLQNYLIHNFRVLRDLLKCYELTICKLAGIILWEIDPEAKISVNSVDIH